MGETRSSETYFAASTPGPCVFPRCVKGEQPSYCGHDCDVREKPYEHEYGTPAIDPIRDLRYVTAELRTRGEVGLADLVEQATTALMLRGLDA